MVQVTCKIEKRIRDLKYQNCIAQSPSMVVCSNTGDLHCQKVQLDGVASLRKVMGKNKHDENMKTNRQNTTGCGAKSRAPKGSPQYLWLKNTEHCSRAHAPLVGAAFGSLLRLLAVSSLGANDLNISRIWLSICS